MNATQWLNICNKAALHQRRMCCHAFLCGRISSYQLSKKLSFWMVRNSKVSHLFVWLTAGTHCYGIPLSKKENLILFCVFIFPEPTAVKYCSGAMRLQESRGNKRLERSDRLSWCCFNGKCGHLPMPMSLKDLILRNAKTRVNNRPPIEFSEPTSLQESVCKHFD